MARIVFDAQAVSTLLMAGIIWFVQIVHYPLFALVPDPHHREFAQSHQSRTGWVVGPLMIVELVTAVAFLNASYRICNATSAAAWFGVALVAVAWLSTGFLQVPLHQRLSLGLDSRAARALTTTNWIRTVAWTLRAALIVSWL